MYESAALFDNQNETPSLQPTTPMNAGRCHNATGKAEASSQSQTQGAAHGARERARTFRGDRSLRWAVRSDSSANDLN